MISTKYSGISILLIIAILFSLMGILLQSAPAKAIATGVVINSPTTVAPAYSMRGGTREILRGIIARGLGLR